MIHCDWCGDGVDEKHSAQLDGSVFHVGMFKDCRNEYLKAQQAQRARDQHARYKLNPEDAPGS